jgi:O-antigen/teichoic acid export membrane protein
VTLFGKILRGSALNVVDHMVRIVAMLIVTPIIVSKLGLERYGVWLLLTSAVSFLALLDGGITLSGTRFLARCQGGTGNEGAVLATLKWLYRWIACACLAGTILLVLAVPWVLKDGDMRETGRAVVLALGLSMALRFFFRLHLVVLKAHLRYDLIVAASLVKVVVQSILVVVLLLQGHGLVVLALAHTLAELIDQILVVLFSRGTGNRPSRKNNWCPSLLPEILRYSGTALLQMVGQQLRTRTDPFIITHYLGVSSVPVYNMALRLVSLFDDLVNAALGGTLLSAFSRFEGENDREGLNRRFLYTLKFSVALALIGGTGLFVLGPAFLVAWLGEDFAASGELLRFLVIPWTLKLMQYPGFSLLYATNQHHWLTKMTFAAGFLNVGLSVVLVSRMGVAGVVVATCIEMALFYAILMPRFVSRSMDIPLLAYLEALLNPAAKLAAPLILWAVTVHFLGSVDFFELALAGGSLLVVGVGASFAFLADRGERERLARLLRRHGRPT